MKLRQRIYVFTDLDDTLFQTRRKCPSEQGLKEAATDRHGQALSFFTPPQQAWLELLGPATVIPVTGRNTAALERVNLDFSSYRIPSHGALVLGPGGAPEPEWLAGIREQIEPWEALMSQVQARLQAFIAHRTLDARCRLIEDQGLAVYISVKGDEAALDALAEEASALWGPEKIHRNGQNLALLPPYACKRRAVAYVMQRLAGQHSPLFVGIGDSLSDLPFLKLCHYAVIPGGSQIQERTWT